MNEPVSVDGAEHVHDLLSDYLNGDLSDAQREAVQAHLNTCAQCQRDFKSLRLTVQLVRQVPLRPVPRTFAVPAPTPRRSWSLLWLRVSTSTLAALFVAVLALRLVLPSGARPAASSARMPDAASRIQTTHSTTAPTVAPAAAPFSAAAPSRAAASESASHPMAASQAAPAAAAPRVEKNEGRAPAAGVAPQPAPPGAASVATATSVTDQTQSIATEAPAPRTNVKEARPTAAASAAPSPRPQAIARPSAAPSRAPASTLPIWYTPLLVTIGALFVVSLVALIWASVRR